MALDVSEAISTAFGSLKTEVGKKLIGIFFLIQVINFGSTYLANLGNTAVTTIALLLTLGTSLASIAATIGGLRSLREEETQKEFFTSNLIRPFGRTLGANITTAAFAYTAGLIFLLPVFIAVLGGSLAASSLGASLSGAGLIGIGLALIGGLLGIAAFTYVTVTLIVAQPLIAIDDKRMFQALDESIQRTKGNRLKIFLAGLVTTLIYGISAIAAGLGALVNQQLGTALIQLLVVPVFTPVFLALLNHFSEALPE